MGETFRKTALWVQARFGGFDPMIQRFDGSLADGAMAPVFILAAPRSGTTLIYQTIVQQLKVSFISNLMAAFPRYMLRMCRAWPALGSRPPRKIHQGEYGFIPGFLSPSEAGKVLDLWFSEELAKTRREEIRRTLAGIGCLTGSPILIKSLSIVQRLPVLKDLFPGVRFIRVTRDPLYTAQSILLGREDPGMARDRWKGVEPPGLSELAGRPELYQACWMVREIERILDEELADVTRPGVHLTYEEFCSNPQAAVDEVAGTLNLALRPGQGPLPDRFPLANKIRLDRGAWEELRSTYRALAS